MTTIGIPKEVHSGERRVAATPQTILKLKKLGFDVLIEAGAGDAINASDGEYQEAGAEIVRDTAKLWQSSDIVMKVRPPEDGEVEMMRQGGWLVGFMWPGQNREIIDRMAKKKATVFAMDSVPRIIACAKDGHAFGDGKHRGLSCDHRSGESLPSLFYRTDNRGGARSIRRRCW
jgi:H+-translocating NAD(P) transhydrogenase subunit alpha